MERQNKEINELKQALLRANQDLEKLSRVKSDFMSIISHELRTPLASIKESVSLVLEGVSGSLNKEQRKFLSITKNNIDRLVKIVTDILDFSKLESGRIAMHKRKMNINELIKDVSVAVRSSVERKKLGFDMQLSEEVEATWLDPDRIAQALKNLISNAVKFNKENGAIKIYSNRECLDGRDVIKVSVEDTGIGISKEHIPGLFKRFSSLDTSMTRQYRGIGLGLAISKGIIEFHGGDIWVESEKGVGTRFIFTLPIYRKDDEFNFLLDEAIERAKYSDLKLALIIFEVKSPRGVIEEVYAELERDIRSVVRGPEDKIARFKNRKFLVIMAGTDRAGAMKIIGRLKNKVKVPLNFGISIYPDEAECKEDLINKAEEVLKTKR